MRVKLSDGTRIERSVFDYRVKKAKLKKKQECFEENGFIYCKECGIHDRISIIDSSHDLSVDKCVKNGCSERAYDLNNITLRCRECHKKYDGLDLRFNNGV